MSSQDCVVAEAGIAMKIRQTGLVLALAITLAIGCRTARRAHHPYHAPRIDTVSHPQSAELSLGAQRGAASAATADELDSAAPNILQVAAAELEDPTKFSPDSVASTRLTIHHAIELGLVQNPDLIALRQADVAIVRLDVRSTRQQQKIAEANLQTAMLELKRHLGWQPDTSVDLEDDVLRWTWRPAESSRMVELASSRPDVMAARADADTARANTRNAVALNGTAARSSPVDNPLRTRSIVRFGLGPRQDDACGGIFILVEVSGTDAETSDPAEPDEQTTGNASGTAPPSAALAAESIAAIWMGMAL